jgi:DNA-binding transcriptional ArsR family regulator
VILQKGDTKQSAGLDSVFSALGDPTRRLIVERLARGPLTISEAGAGIPISQPAISKHVKVLEQSGLVRREVAWRVHRLHLSPRAMQAASSWIERQRQFWEAALDRLDAYLLATPETKKKKGKRPK